MVTPYLSFLVVVGIHYQQGCCCYMDLGHRRCVASRYNPTQGPSVENLGMAIALGAINIQHRFTTGVIRRATALKPILRDQAAALGL